MDELDKSIDALDRSLAFASAEFARLVSSESPESQEIAVVLASIDRGVARLERTRGRLLEILQGPALDRAALIEALRDAYAEDSA